MIADYLFIFSRLIGYRLSCHFDDDVISLSAIRTVIGKYSTGPLAAIPANKEKIAYGRIKLDKNSFLFDVIRMKGLVDVIESQNPISMEAIGQVIINKKFLFFFHIVQIKG